MIYYFSYGSNMDMDRLRRRGIMILGWQTASLPNYKLVFDIPVPGRERKKEAYPNVEYSPGESVNGVMYSIADNGLEVLNNAEGGFRKELYKIIFAPVKTDRDKIVIDNTCFHMGKDEFRVEGLKPYLKHLNLMIHGAKSHELEYRNLEEMKIRCLKEKETFLKHILFIIGIISLFPIVGHLLLIFMPEFEPFKPIIEEYQKNLSHREGDVFFNLLVTPFLLLYYAARVAHFNIFVGLIVGLIGILFYIIYFLIFKARLIGLGERITHMWEIELSERTQLVITIIGGSLAFVSYCLLLNWAKSIGESTR